MQVSPVPETVADYKRRIASGGGKARARKLTPARRTEIARQASLARWAKYRKEQKGKVA